MYTKKGEVITIIILILNLLLLVYLINYKVISAISTNINEAEPGQLVSQNVDEKTSVVFNNKLFPNNYIEFENQYSGDVNLDNVYLRLNVFIKYINSINLDELKSDELIVKYYNSNSNYIKSATTIDNLQDFKKMSNKILSIFNDKQLGYQNVYFNLDVINKNQYEICIKYEEDKILYFNLVLNEVTKDFKFVF